MEVYTFLSREKQNGGKSRLEWKIRFVEELYQELYQEELYHSQDSSWPEKSFIFTKTLVKRYNINIITSNVISDRSRVTREDYAVGSKNN